MDWFYEISQFTDIAQNSAIYEIFIKFHLSIKLQVKYKCVQLRYHIEINLKKYDTKISA